MISIYGSMSKNLHHSMPSSTSSSLHYSHSREIAQKSSFMHRKNSSILHPISHSHSSINGKKRGRTSSEDTLSSLSPNINGSIKRQRRKISTNNSNNIQSTLPSLVSLSPKPITKNVSKRTKNRSRSKPKKRVLADTDNWSETDDHESYSENSGDDDYIPPKNKQQRSIQQQREQQLKTENDSDSDSDTSMPSGYRPLNWRKNEVATPKFVKISDANLHFLPPSLHRHKSTPNSLKMASTKCLKRAQSVTDMTKVEDTSNEAYFYRHYRAEAREKLFYEQLFDQRLKQQQILEQKAKRKKKKNENEHANDDCVTNGGGGDGEIDLSLPTLPKGPWSFKLGPEYDSKPLVPSNVINRPQFNYDIPFKQLSQRRFMNESERKEMENWWKMPSHLIRRTDYGNIVSSKVCVDDDDARKNKKKKNKKRVRIKEDDDDDEKEMEREEDEAAKKRELIQLYKLAKQAAKKDGKKRHKKKHKHNKKYKKEKKREKRKVFGGPVDVRMLLK